MKKTLTLILTFLITKSQIPSPAIQHPLHAAYNNFWDGAVGGKGYWGETPSKTPSIFSSTFDKKGVNSIYSLSSKSPFAHQRSLGFESLVPYYTPFGASRYTYYPTKSNYLNNKQLGSFSYDINEPRYQKLYQDYFNFFNTNLERLESVEKYHKDNSDLNNDHFRKMENPESYDYEKYFDGFSELSTLPGPHLKFFGHKNDEQPSRKLVLKEKKKKLMRNIIDDIVHLEREKKKKSIERKLKVLRKDLKDVREDKKRQKRIYNELYLKERTFKPDYPRIADSLKPYEMDSKVVF